MFYVIQQPTTYNYPFFSPKWFGDLDEEKRASSTMSKCKWVVRGVSTAPIRMHYSTLPKIVVVYKLFHLSNSFYLIFFLVLLLLHFFFSEVFHSFLHPPKHLFFYMLYSFSFPGPSLLCWGFARISRCITVVIACRDCLQLSERTSVSVQHWLSLSLSFSWLYFVEFFFFFLAYSSSSLLVDFLLFCSSRENGGGGGLMAQLIC